MRSNSGSGKSVLLRLLAGLIKPNQGEIRIDGTDTVPLNEDQMLSFRQRMGVVFQQAALFAQFDEAQHERREQCDERQRDQRIEVHGHGQVKDASAE